MCILVSSIAPFLDRVDNPKEVVGLTNISSIGDMVTRFYLETLVINYWNGEFVPTRHEECKSCSMCTLVSWIALVAVLIHTCKRELSPAHLVCPQRHNA
jgi:hypothetical protein